MSALGMRGQQAWAAEAPRPLSPEDVRAAVLTNLGVVLGSGDASGAAGERIADALALSVRSEALRASLWALSAGGSEPVYVIRLLHAARPLSEPASTEGGCQTDDDVLASFRGALEELETTGDVNSLPRGHWLPTPLRCVPLPGVRRWLLVGGRPTYRLPLVLREAIEHNGVARLLTMDPAALGFMLPVQDQDDWTRAPRAPLADWTRGVMDEATFRPFDDPEATFDYYAPRVMLNKLQYYRWLTNYNTLPAGRYLARHRGKRGPTSYAIVEVQQGKVEAIGSFNLDEGDIRRLLYGLDSLAGCPVLVRVTHTRAAWIFELSNELPSAEHRLFTALGRLHLLPDGAYYPRRWEVAVRYAVHAARALRRLDVHLDGGDELLGAVEETDSEL